jgi:hypothetical protein
MSPVKPNPAQRYPGLNDLPAGPIRDAVKNIFDMVGQLQQQVPNIGKVTAPLAGSLNANGNQLKSVADPTHGQDAVPLDYMRKYVESRVVTLVNTATGVTAPGGVLHPSPPSDGPIIPGPTPAPGPTPLPPHAGAPPPTPPPNAPPGTGTFSSTDMLNLNTVIVENSPPDIATWPQTATITALTWTTDGVEVLFTKRDGTGRWPDVIPPGFDGPLEYTLWLFLNIGGQWYGSGIIQYWNGKDFNGGPPSGVALNWVYDSRWGPMAGYQPATGETIGMMVSAGNARGQTTVSSVKERSQVILIPFPSDAGATYHT